MSRVKKTGIYAAVAALSVLMMLCWFGFEREGFLFDDNRTQWYPVMKSAYDEFFTDGKMPVYDFYQMKGMKISEPGYYGTTNPLMAFSFAAVRFLHIPLSEITVCLLTAFALGNMLMYAVCKQLGCGERLSLLMTLAYCSCSGFITFSNWYYVFNNYFIVPLIILVILKSADTPYEFFAPGTVLAFDLLLGNAQYTCYHYMMYCVICVITGILKRKRSFAAMLSNVAAGLVLSLPSFVLLMNAAENFGGVGFFSDEMSIASIIFNSMIPMGILNKFGLNGENFPLFNAETIQRTDRMIFYIGAIAAPVFLIGIHGLVKAVSKRGKSKKDKSGKTSFVTAAYKRLAELYKSLCQKSFAQKTTIGLTAAFIFFLLFVSEGVAAEIVYLFPVINRFRFLFKTWYVIIPLLVPLAAVLINKCGGGTKKAAVVVCLSFGIIGTVNNYFVYRHTKNMFISEDMTMEEEAAYAEKLISEIGLDLKNYRTLALLENDTVDNDAFDYKNNYARNFMSYIRGFSVGAYENAVSPERLKQYNMLMSDERLFTTHINAGVFEDIEKNLEEQPELTEQQLISNSVKYLIVRNAAQSGDICKETLTLSDLINSLENVKVVRAVPLNRGYDLIELEGVNSICTDGNGNSIPLAQDSMDLLGFDAGGAEKLTFSFAYDDGLFAYSETEDGARTYAEISEDENGNAVIDASKLTGRVYLGYEGRIYGVSFAFEIIVTAAFAIVSFLTLIGTAPAGKTQAAKG